MNIVTAAIVLVVLLCAAGVAHADPAEELIRVSPDGWHFETAVTNQRFVPFGGVYFDSATYAEHPFPRFLLLSKFDESRTDRHFADIAALGANLVRISLSTGVMCPEYGKLDLKAVRTLDRIVNLAAKHGLRVVLDPYVEWDGTAKWFCDSWEMYTDSRNIRGMELYYSAIAAHYNGNPTVFSYLLMDEPRMPWTSEGMKVAWGDWVKRKYHSESELKQAWSDYPRADEDFTKIAVPENEPDPKSARLYDYQQFREDLAARFVKTLASAIRSTDTSHMISLGNLQWSAPFRMPGLDEPLSKPASYPAFSPAKIGKYLDYLHINCYDWWDSNVRFYAQALGRFSYYPGKPVITGEFSFDTETIERNNGTFAGFSCWAFYPLPSEPIHHYLFDKEEKRTAYGEAFAKLAQRIRAGEFVLDRKTEQDTLDIDMRRYLCDPTFGAQLYNEYMDKCRDGKIIGVKLD